MKIMFCRFWLCLGAEDGRLWGSWWRCGTGETKIVQVGLIFYFYCRSKLLKTMDDWVVFSFPIFIRKDAKPDFWDNFFYIVEDALNTINVRPLMVISLVS